MNLKSAINGVGGLYSVEIEATCNSGSFGDGNTRTTWNYNSPTLSYEKNQTDNNGLTQINNFLGYFVVGNVGVYRSMVVFNGMYHDIRKFVPGNPSNPANLNIVPKSASDVYNNSIGYTAATKLTSAFNNSTPTPICYANSSSLTLPMGAEVNVWKKTGSDVTGAKMKYRVYKVGSSAPAYSEFNVPYKDNCPGGYNASTGSISTFATGGSCWSGQTQSTAGTNLDNSITMQRWQVTQGVANILPTPFSASDVGDWVIEYYTEVTTSAGTVADNVQTTAFSIVGPITVNGSAATCTPSPLPVKLVSFTAKTEEKTVVLEWQTSSEINNSHFEVEKSYDAKDFSSIGTVGSKGDSDALVEYSFTDEAPQSGINYYRLRQVDNDGKFEYSKIRSINYTGSYSIKVEPNPTDDYIIFRGLKNNSSLEIIDTNGVQLYQSTISNGNSDLKLNVSNYHSGLYIVRVVHENKVEIRKFFVN